MAATWVANTATTSQEMSRLAGAIDGSYYINGTGGAVTPSSGMVLSVSAIVAANVVANSVAGTTAYAGSTVTVSTSDPSLPRRDWVYYDVSDGTCGVTAGTPAASTATTGPVLPNLSASRIGLAEIAVAAGATTISAGNISDRRQAGPAMRLVANFATPTATTSTSAVDLVVITGLSIPVTSGIKIIFNWRKTAASADYVSFSFKINSTTVGSVAGGASIRSSATQQAEDGIGIINIAPQSSNYLNGWVWTGAGHASSSGASNGQILPVTVGQSSGSAAMPNATVTSITITAINNTNSNAAEVSSVQIWRVG